MHNKNIFKIHPFYRKIIAPLRKSKILSGCVFGVKVFDPNPKYYWDWVTLCLRKALSKEKLEINSFLDMGCGFHAILSLYAFHMKCRSITAIDIIPDIIKSAKGFLERNGVKADVILSDFVDSIPGKIFDIIAFNAAYIPEEWGNIQGINNKLPLSPKDQIKTWSGGRDGLDCIRNFLDKVPKALTSNGKILLGFNSYYIRDADVRAIVDANKLYVDNVITLSLLPAIVFSIRKINQEGYVDE
ncbi:MAG: 50S ribosomal protein L11 methyltransferase [candidate division Zixibacteria bacterium]